MNRKTPRNIQKKKAEPPTNSKMVYPTRDWKHSVRKKSTHQKTFGIIRLMLYGRLYSHLVCFRCSRRRASFVLTHCQVRVLRAATCAPSALRLRILSDFGAAPFDTIIFPLGFPFWRYACSRHSFHYGTSTVVFCEKRKLHLE